MVSENLVSWRDSEAALASRCSVWVQVSTADKNTSKAKKMKKQKRAVQPTHGICRASVGLHRASF